MAIRLDIWLVQNGFFESREKAQIAIAEEGIAINGKIVIKAAATVLATDTVEVLKRVLSYVSRGGTKLEKAITEFQLDFANKVVLDVGASTGGFTDCALQHGAAKVLAVDVGTGQLHPSLQHHPQVRWWEGVHIRELTLEMLGSQVDIIVVDVSFISLQAVFPLLPKFLKKDGFLITLVKPQFEMEEKIRLKKGIVKNKNLHEQVLDKIAASARACGFLLQNRTSTDADGQQKNLEYLAHWVRSGH